LFVVPDESPLEGSACYIAPSEGGKAPYLNAKEYSTSSAEVYTPELTVKRPPGLASLGMDAFKLECHINDVNGPATEVVANSGVAATLISAQCLRSLGNRSPTIRQGLKLRLLHLTREAQCLGYITLNLYFHSQLGPVLLQGVEAYVVEGMNTNLLIGKYTHRAWQLHTMRPEHKAYWEVRDSEHRVPTNHTTRDEEAFITSWQQEDEPPYEPLIGVEPKDSRDPEALGRPQPGKGRIFAAEDVCIPGGHIAHVQVEADFNHQNGLMVSYPQLTAW
jgi:hypothetical protein